MTIKPISRNEKNLGVIVDAIQQITQGRSNAHGTFTLGTGVTTTTVTAINCSENSCISVTPKTANAATACQDGAFYIVPGNGSFVVHHASTANTDCDFHYSING
jgi:hypothetical protein